MTINKYMHNVTTDQISVDVLTKSELKEHEQKISDYLEKKAKAQAEAEAKAAQRQAILDRLGLTADEAKLLLG
jgi:hypothetical protein